ncbi:MAG: hypothetical protein KC506_04025, partial [Nanoarchaeota archaeon]|nr:hypothetical protein [Nanoarchaeota archaeon]
KSKLNGAKLELICDLFPQIATQAIGLTQKNREQNIYARYQAYESDTKQKQALYSVAEIHKGKKGDYIKQAAIFGSVSTCYTAAAIMQAGEAVVVTKAAAAAFLATWFTLGATKHSEVNKQAKYLAEKMPGKGDCVPGTPCFCAEETSAESDPILYQNYCVNNLLKRLVATSYPSACIDSQGKPDLQCSCMKTNNCFDNYFLKNLNGDILTNKVVRDLINHNAKTIFGSNPTTTQLDSLTKSNVNKTTSALAKLDGSLINKAELTDTEKSNLSLLKQSNIPQNVASILAKANVSNKYSQSFNQNNGMFLKKSNSRVSSNSSSKKGSNAPDLSSMFGSLSSASTNQKHSGGIEYVTNSQSQRRVASQNRALQLAQINRNESKPIFEIISSRYKKNTWEDLDQ